ncbi:MaoC family dehydratase [Sphingomonas oligophenolica]|uniref:MaoC family dehydratase n=1 Tax=Sphingomonas oligophenolica TaxID=301154 RepID=A0ABU9YB12_9SPHN
MTDLTQTTTAQESALVSDWLVVDQDMISRFGELTLDPDPMHMDPEWAKANGPYGGTIAYGFLTISLLSHLVHLVRPDTGGARTGYFLNYGFDRLRLVSPVRAGARIRGRFLPNGPKPDEKGRILNRYDCSIEIEGEDRPALVAEWLSLWVPNIV